jgi:hypothetical protein
MAISMVNAFMDTSSQIVNFAQFHMKDEAPPSSLMDSTASPKGEIAEREGVGARSLAHNT